MKTYVEPSVEIYSIEESDVILASNEITNDFNKNWFEEGSLWGQN